MKIRRIILKNLVFLLAGAFIGLLALMLVFCLPVEPIKWHLIQSVPMIEREFENSELVLKNEATLTGNFTDCLMMEHAVYISPEHSFLEQVLFMYRGESCEGGPDDWEPGYSLVDYLSGREPLREVQYARYWHGYLVVLKPLLFLTTFNAIRVMAGIAQFILAALIVLLCAKRGEDLLGAAFFLSVPCLYFFTMYSSLSLSICYYIVAAALILQLLRHEKMEEKGSYFIFFLFVGMATSYFDFLTYPLVTLGYPLCVCLYLGREGWKKKLQKLIFYCAEWSVGYLGLWAMKWVLTDLLAGGNTISDACATLFIRTDAAEGYSRVKGFFSVIAKSMEPYRTWGFYFLALGILFFSVFLVRRGRKNITKETAAQGGVLFLAALLPFGWLFLVQNHVEQHWMFAFKILAVSVFAGILAIGKLLGKGGNAHG